jgi:hypothetical protein
MNTQGPNPDRKPQKPAVSPVRQYRAQALPMDEPPIPSLGYNGWSGDVCAASLADAARVIQGLFESRIRETALSAGIDLRSPRASMVFRIARLEDPKGQFSLSETTPPEAAVYRVNVFGAFPVDTNTDEE